MIDYAILCQAIGDWRAGRRPTLPPSSTPTLPASASATVPEGPYEEEVDSEMLVVDEYSESGAPEGYESPDHTPVAPIEHEPTMSYGAGYDPPSEE